MPSQRLPDQPNDFERDIQISRLRGSPTSPGGFKVQQRSSMLEYKSLKRPFSEDPGLIGFSDKGFDNNNNVERVSSRNQTNGLINPPSPKEELTKDMNSDSDLLFFYW